MAELFAFPPALSPAELAGFDLNDFGNAMRLIRVAGGVIEDDGSVSHARATLLHQVGLGWVGFNGRHWDRKFGEQLATRMAHKVAAMMRSTDVRDILLGRGLTTKDLQKFIDGLGNRGGTSAMLKQAESYLTVEIDDFDNQPMALNCLNGTLWLEALDGGVVVTKKPHDPADRITRLIEVEWNPKAECPVWTRTVAGALPDEEQRGFLKRCLGYGVTGHTHEQAMFILQGKGRDSKSTVLGAVRELLGGYGATGNVATFLDQGVRGAGDASSDLVKLAGDTRFVVLSEPTQGARLNEGLLKAWTGGDPIPARELREKAFDFLPIGKLFMECNALPAARGADDGLWRRINVILFEHQVPIDKIDRQLRGKLRAEFPGILNWLIDGVGDWVGRGGLDAPAKVRKALEDYRKMSSPFGDWLTERCVAGEAAAGHRTLAKTLYSDFKQWFEDQGNDKPMSQRSFGDALHQRQILLAGKDRTGAKYRGPIRLKTNEELAAERLAAGEDEEAFGAGGGSAGDDVFAISEADLPDDF